MKQLTCEMCGSTELIKQDGFFVCQTCGTKYSVEEAKKMMIEGTVDVQGTVKLDSSDELKNLYELARRAKADDNNENAQRFYEQILVKDPSSWEANFYTTYYQAMNCKIAEIALAALALEKCQKTTLSLIQSNVSDPQELKKSVTTVAFDVLVIANMLFNSQIDHYNNIAFSIRSNYAKECVNICLCVAELCYSTGNAINELFNSEYADIAAGCWKNGLAQHQTILNDAVFKIFINKDVTSKTIDTYAKMVVDAEERAFKHKKNMLSELSTDDLISSAITDLETSQNNVAIVKFTLITERLPDERFGYLGKAIATYYKDESITSENYNVAAECVITASTKNSGAEYDAVAKKLLDFQEPISSNSLLISICKVTLEGIAVLNLEAAKALIDMGANINLRNNDNVNALWYITHKSLFVKDKANGIELAKILLDNGSEVEVTSNSGVALFNLNTPHPIFEMVRKAHPELNLGKGASGCYVATCVYGSYDCPQVWTLRRYRDDTLGATWHGRLFIRTYYAISPTLVKWFGNTNWFKKLWKGKLDRMVAKLQSNGVEDTPYEDKNW